MRKPLMLLTASLALSAMLAGCAANQGDLGNRNIRPNSVRHDANGNLIYNNQYSAKRFANDQLNEMNQANGKRLNSNNIVGYHKNYKIEMSEEIAHRIAKMGAVKTSNVMLTDNNAYVAVSFNHHVGHHIGKGTGTGIKSGMPTAKGVGVPNAVGRTGSVGDYRTYNSDTNHRYGTLAAEDSQLTEAIKKDIANEVKRMYPRVKNVYVSANPDFVGRMEGYMNDVRNGHPIQGFIAEFNAMAERIFPANATRISTKATEKSPSMIYDYNR
ncbi:YhcN/YlaJ family sporulation lipoprotein [Paenibacillus sp. NPDC058071]|uniref:YhcN/YlaJ family sporulation lipoprotein n=1 Tax=Paenibacillus sp. NPDC058071 TaxID=3346326 RepID=UPI0036DDEF31